MDEKFLISVKKKKRIVYFILGKDEINFSRIFPRTPEKEHDKFNEKNITHFLLLRILLHIRQNTRGNTCA